MVNEVVVNEQDKPVYRIHESHTDLFMTLVEITLLHTYSFLLQ